MTDTKIFNSVEAACQCVGIEPRPVRPGAFVRTNVVNDRRGKGDGVIKGHQDGKGGIVQNWKTGKQALFFYDYREGQKVTKAVVQAYQRELAARLREEAKQTAARHDAVAALAAQIMQAAKTSISHPYLRRKRVLGAPGAPTFEIDRNAAQALIDRAQIPQADGKSQSIRWAGGRLLCVPLTDDRGVLRSLQLIDSNEGTKIFMKGGQKTGLFWRPDDLPVQSWSRDPIGLCEGVATALSVRVLFGLPCVAGIDAGNLKAAAQNLRRAYPSAPIIVFADRDANNKGELGAKAAAMTVDNVHVALCPELTAEELRRFREITGTDRPTDFNDLMIGRAITPDVKR